MRYFFADYESSLYNYRTFFSFFKDFCEKADLSSLVNHRVQTTLTFKDWKSIKRQIVPFKPFNRGLIEKVSAQKIYSSDVSQNIPNVN